MDANRVLHMNGGKGITSYAQNSWLQQQILQKTKPIREETIRILHEKMTTDSLAIAELGCSSGPNALCVVEELMKTVNNLEYSSDLRTKALNVYLNDLPSNDFNTIFKSLSDLQDRLKKNMIKSEGTDCQINLYIYGAPGSFFGRLFDTRSIHFIHSSYAVHFLSKVPEGIGRNHKNSIYMSSKSPPTVLEAYYGQFKSDFSTFLRSRSEEIVDKGCMVLTTIGRKSEDRSSKDGGSYTWELIAMALNQLVIEGLIDEESLDLFNIPIYYPSIKEIEQEVANEESFTTNRLEVFEIDWDHNHTDNEMCNGNQNERRYNIEDHNTTGSAVAYARCIRAVAEPMIVDHFGEEISKEAFKRYNLIVADVMAKERNYFYNITVSLTKK